VNDAGAESSATASANDVPASTHAATSQDRQLLADLPSTHRPTATGHSNGAMRNHKVRAPAVNRLNTPDCHSLPQDLLKFAKERRIELWAGGSGEGSGEFPGFHSVFHSTQKKTQASGVTASDSIMMRFTNK
jgi:hypothetical protein